MELEHRHGKYDYTRQFEPHYIDPALLPGQIAHIKFEGGKIWVEQADPAKSQQGNFVIAKNIFTRGTGKLFSCYTSKTFYVWTDQVNDLEKMNFGDSLYYQKGRICRQKVSKMPVVRFIKSYKNFACVRLIKDCSQILSDIATREIINLGVAENRVLNGGAKTAVDDNYETAFGVTRADPKQNPYEKYTQVRK